MRTHAVFLRLEGRRCVVIGGDAVAEPKIVACLEAGADVTVVAETLTPEVAALIAAARVRHVARGPRDGDLAGAVVAYAATRDPELIGRLRAEAAREHVLLNVIDVPDACDFISPAVVRRGALQIAIATGGASPALSARLRRELEAHVGPEYATYVAVLAAVRRGLGNTPTRAAVVTALLDSPLLDLLRRGDRPGVDALLRSVVGDDCTLERLGVAA